MFIDLRTVDKAEAFKQNEGEFAGDSPEEMLNIGEFMKLEDLATYMFDIKPFSNEFNECIYHPALTMVTVGGTESGQMATVSQLFSYEYDKKIYEDDRRNFADVFYKKLKNYFESTQSRAGIPVVFNARIYLIVDATLDPEPSVFMLDPHDMMYLVMSEKKKKVPMQYILGSPTGATLFFPPVDDEIKNRIKAELQSL